MSNICSAKIFVRAAIILKEIVFKIQPITHIYKIILNLVCAVVNFNI